MENLDEGRGGGGGFPLLSEKIAGPRRQKIQNAINTSSVDHSEEARCELIPYYILIENVLYWISSSLVSLLNIVYNYHQTSEPLRMC